MRVALRPTWHGERRNAAHDAAYGNGANAILRLPGPTIGDEARASCTLAYEAHRWLDEADLEWEPAEQSAGLAGRRRCEAVVLASSWSTLSLGS